MNAEEINTITRTRFPTISLAEFPATALTRETALLLKVHLLNSCVDKVLLANALQIYLKSRNLAERKLATMLWKQFHLAEVGQVLFKHTEFIIKPTSVNKTKNSSHTHSK
jgi:hypothetical protein